MPGRSRGFYRGHGAKYQMAGNRPQTRAGWECPEDREKAEEVLSISARKLFNLTSALNDWDRLTGDKAATLTLGVAAKTIDHSIVTRATQGEDCSKAALTDDVNLSKKKHRSLLKLDLQPDPRMRERGLRERKVWGLRDVNTLR